MGHYIKTPAIKKRPDAPDAPIIATKTGSGIPSHLEYETQVGLPTNAEIQIKRWQQIHPHESNFKTSPTWTFRLEKRDDSWIDISGIRLLLKLKITNNGVDLAENEDHHARVEKFWPHLLFSKVDFKVNTHQMPETSHYQYRTYLPRILSMATEDLPAAQADEGFYPTNTHHQVFDENADITKPLQADQDENTLTNTTHMFTKYKYSRFLEQNPGLVYAGSHGVLSGSKEYYFELPINLDICEQSVNVPPGIQLEFQFHRHKNPWLPLIGNHDAADGLRIDVTQCEMLIPWTNLKTETNEARIKAIMHNDMTAKMPIIKRRINIQPIGMGTTHEPKLQYDGLIPRRVVVGFIKNDYIHGDKEHSCFNFSHFNIEEFYLEVAGTQYPSYRTKYDFTGAKKDRVIRKVNARPYMDFMIDAIPNQIQKPYYDLKHWECDGPLWVFDLTADRNAANAMEYKSEPKMGAIIGHIRTTEGLENYSMVIMFEQDGLIELPINNTPPIVDL